MMRVACRIAMGGFGTLNYPADRVGCAHRSYYA
ncbi:hypothetical protein SIID45300_01790 [Candidatus Magnetaquicoccaceae bacterium FCR-1]|uniref:Uncharacterized protein n=1 Tax=Candidatus Magnetaquiglobus chichijimensis TaxID=3141448 RepID=A0ABQ0C9A6_9PROT